MPLALFFVSILLSASLFLSSFRIVQDSAVNQYFIDSAAAFSTASSHMELSSSLVVPDFGQNVVDTFQQVPVSQDFQLIVNHGVVSSSEAHLFDTSADPFEERFFESSGELMLFDVSPEDAVDWIEIEYCSSDDYSCPDLLFDWFELDRDFRFQDLSLLETQPAQGQVLGNCVELYSFGVRRCVAASPLGSPNQFQMMDSDMKSGYRKRARLRTYFPAYHYLFRFRSLDRTPFSFRLTGIKGGEGGERVPLPHAFVSLDETAQTRYTRRRLRQQQQVTAGLQDGLEFVHYSHEVESK